jgi:hypothetical protein
VLDPRELARVPAGRNLSAFAAATQRFEWGCSRVIVSEDEHRFFVRIWCRAEGRRCQWTREARCGVVNATRDAALPAAVTNASLFAAPAHG